MSMSTANSPIPTLTFRLSNTNVSSKFAPRIGQLTLTRPAPGGDGLDIKIPTPGLMSSTARGVIQHLSRDNVKRTPCVRWVHVPFESFLQVDPPVPTLQQGRHPLHTFLGFSPSRHVLSMSLRDPADGREMPSNGKLFVAAQSSRGTRKVACPAYRSYIAAVLPDIVFPLSDIPFITPPHSQKRISKSIERTTQWLTTFLAPLNDASATTGTAQPAKAPRLNVFLHMVGGIRPAARAAFATALQEPLEPKEKEMLAPLETLDEGISGYVFDLVPLRTALMADAASAIQTKIPPAPVQELFAPLIRASLEDLPATKPRLANTTHSPHEILALIRDAGVDLFDTFWAQRAATWGVALDFRFPVPREPQPDIDIREDDPAGSRSKRDGGRDLGHNLYDSRYAHDFGRLADALVDGLEFSKRHHTPDTPQESNGDPAVCACAACSPVWENDPIIHSAVDERRTQQVEQAQPYTRAYLHHLLHTHEMSAHALLVMHNLTVVDGFMRGVRDVLGQDIELRAQGSEGTDSLFSREVERFEQTYDAELRVLDEARTYWEEVDRARGKGRLARERAKKLAEELGADMEVEVPAAVAVGDLEG